MKTHSKTQTIGWALLVILVLSLSGGVLAQDQGFDITYEGVVDSEPEAVESTFVELSLYGVGGFSAGGAFWASGGARANFSLEGFTVYGDGSYGTSGLEIRAGAQTEFLGFGVAGDATWTLGNPAVIDLRTWGKLDIFRLTINVRLAGANSAITLSGNTDFERFGLSANLGVASGNLTQASIGANTQMGGLSISGSGGLSAGGLNVGGGAGFQLGPVSVIANAGYDGAVGLNATGGATVGWEPIELSVIGLYDNTGVGLQVSSELKLGSTTLTFMGRFSGGGLTGDVGGNLPLGAAIASFSVAFDSQNGFAWAEVGFEMPL
jgi:hypothetical protein